jgi:hypothetical protein
MEPRSICKQWKYCRKDETDLRRYDLTRGTRGKYLDKARRSFETTGATTMQSERSAQRRAASSLRAGAFSHQKHMIWSRLPRPLLSGFGAGLDVRTGASVVRNFLMSQPLSADKKEPKVARFASSALE